MVCCVFDCMTDLGNDMGLLPDTLNCGLCMRSECRENFHRHRGLTIPTYITARASRTHHGTCVAHVPWCMLGSLTRGFIWSQCRGKRSRHSRCMRNLRFYLSGMRPMVKDSAVCLVKNRDLVNQCVAGYKIDQVDQWNYYVQSYKS